MKRGLKFFVNKKESWVSSEHEKKAKKKIERISLALTGFKNKEWILSWSFTEGNKLLDRLGIDAFIKFKFNGGKQGAFSFQIKSRNGEVTLHKRRYPGIPVVVLGSSFSEKEIENTLIKFFYDWNVFNEGKMEKIFSKNKDILK